MEGGRGVLRTELGSEELEGSCVGGGWAAGGGCGWGNASFRTCGLGASGPEIM